MFFPVGYLGWSRLSNGWNLLPLFLQTHPLPLSMPFMLGIDALQLQIGEDFRKFHIEPSMGMSFPKIVANRRLTDEVQMLFLGMLPLMPTPLRAL